MGSGFRAALCKAKLPGFADGLATLLHRLLGGRRFLSRSVEAKSSALTLSMCTFSFLIMWSIRTQAHRSIIGSFETILWPSPTGNMLLRNARVSPWSMCPMCAKQGHAKPFRERMSDPASQLARRCKFEIHHKPQGMSERVAGPRSPFLSLLLQQNYYACIRSFLAQTSCRGHW